ncbi:MAG: DUF2141 domain-containing protein [Myxococcaceae bacterium]
MSIEKNVTTLCTLALLSACGGPAPAASEPTIKLATGTARLDATVANVKLSKGKVFCALFNAAEGFPGASPIIGGATSADASAATVPCQFAALPAGDYAISVFQDEDGNGKLDLNAFGAPIEGYGASNNQLPAAEAPHFDDSKVHLDDGQTLTLTINLK